MELVTFFFFFFSLSFSFALLELSLNFSNSATTKEGRFIIHDFHVSVPDVLSCTICERFESFKKTMDFPVNFQ
jgi:hypothetical protein